MHAGRIHGGGYQGGPRPTHPIAGVRPGRPGYPAAGRPGRPIAGYPGGYYPRNCYQGAYGNTICPQQYPY